jgi:hypothetical protein
MILGILFLFLGGCLLFCAHPSAVKASFPRGVILQRVLWSAGILVGYWAFLPILGYLVSTFLALVALFKSAGGYRWTRGLLLGAIVVLALHVVFRVWLLLPLPRGLLGL